MAQRGAFYGGPQAIAQVLIDPLTAGWIQQRVPTHTLDQINRIIEEILKEAIAQTIDDGKKWIRRYVPKATGMLQDELVRVLENNSKIVANALRLVIGVLGQLGAGKTAFEYIEYVVRMSQQMVRHPKSPYVRFRAYTRADGSVVMKRYVVNPNVRWVNYYPYTRKYRKIYLHDPTAVGKFWGLLKQYLRQRLRVRLAEAIRTVSGRYRIRAKPFSQKLKVRRV